MTTASASIEELAINTIRTLSMDGVQAANSGHPGTPNGLGTSRVFDLARSNELRPVASPLARTRSIRSFLRSRFDAVVFSLARCWREEGRCVW